MRSRVIPANDYVRSRWRNAAGWTREIHAQPSRFQASGETGTTDWDWRLSIAEIEQAAAFSRFEGVERELVLLSGNALQLDFGDGKMQQVLPPHDRCRFPGEARVKGEPLGGVVHVFNLMWRRDLVDAQLWHRPLVGPMVVFADPASIWAVYLIAGHARFADDSGLPDLSAGDTALLQADQTRLRHVIEGAGEALMIRFLPSRCADRSASSAPSAR